MEENRSEKYRTWKQYGRGSVTALAFVSATGGTAFIQHDRPHSCDLGVWPTGARVLSMMIYFKQLMRRLDRRPQKRSGHSRDVYDYDNYSPSCFDFNSRTYSIRSPYLSAVLNLISLCILSILLNK